ncbi:Protein saf4 [Coemansia sp. RSA 1285]|nr:Protein saf4 [Coemansia sp. RSA 1285]
MAERKAVNKYYPPDWDPSKGSVNKFVNQHPLRSRARKLDEGILIVRMALPFSMWCDGCGKLLAKGLRFNAEKKKAGEFLNSTIPVWSLRIKCRMCCEQWIEIQTDPEKTSYVVVSGARKKAEPEADNGGNGDGDGDEETLGEDIIDMASISTKTFTEKKGGSRLRELEFAEYKRKRAAQSIERLAKLKKDRDKNWKNSDRANSKLREVFRMGRSQREMDKRESNEIQQRMGIDVPILPADMGDSIEAATVQYGDNADEASSRRQISLECAARPLFSTASKRGGKMGLKDRVVRKRLGELDPFSSPSLGHFKMPANLGIRPESPDKAKVSDALIDLSLAYGSQSSESSDQNSTS